MAIVAAVAHREFAERDAHDLGRKTIRDGCFIDVKSRFNSGALREAGLRVPDDMSVVAFDDLPEEWVSEPFLTVAAQPALAALLRRWFPDRLILIVTEALRAQEQFQQDLETWLSDNAEPGTMNAERKRGREVAGSGFRAPHSAFRVHFSPSTSCIV